MHSCESSPSLERAGQVKADLPCSCLPCAELIMWFSEGQCSGTKFEATRAGFLIARHVGIASAAEAWCLLFGCVG